MFSIFKKRQVDTNTTVAHQGEPVRVYLRPVNGPPLEEGENPGNRLCDIVIVKGKGKRPEGEGWRE